MLKKHTGSVTFCATLLRVSGCAENGSTNPSNPPGQAEAKQAFLSSGGLHSFSRHNGQPSNVRVGSVQYGMALGPPGPRDFYACMIWDREVINDETVAMLVNGKWVKQDTLETHGAALFRQNGDSTWEANLVDYVGSPFYNRNCT